MPLYEYCCDKHGVFDAFRSMAQSNEPSECPICGAESPRVLSLPRTNLLDSNTRNGMDRNEKSRHEPQRAKAKPGPATGPDGMPLVKSSSGPRPWMI